MTIYKRMTIEDLAKLALDNPDKDFDFATQFDLIDDDCVELESDIDLCGWHSVKVSHWLDGKVVMVGYYSQVLVSWHDLLEPFEENHVQFTICQGADLSEKDTVFVELQEEERT